MVGRELVVKRNGPVDIREISAKATLREVRQSGHTYVELRRVGKRVIFFCTICLTECFSDNVLFDHLKGNLHSRRYAEAKVTLFGPMPWPFNDGVLFFNNSREKDPLLLDSSSQSTRELALVPLPQPEVSRNDTEVTSKLRDGSSSCNGVKGARNGGKGRANGTAAVSEDHVLSNSGTDGPLVIPGVLLKDFVSDLPVHLLGYGNISYRICEASKNCKKISKIWCAWVFFFSSRRRHTRYSKVTGVQTCALPIYDTATTEIGRASCSGNWLFARSLSTLNRTGSRDLSLYS